MGIWEWNIQSNQTVYNDQWAALLGYTLDELAPYDHATWERLTHPEDLKRASEALLDCVEGRTPEYRCELRMKHKDGHWVWILDRGRIKSHDAEGEPLSMFGTHTDITDIKSTAEDLRASEAYQSRILQTTADGIWVVDSKGHIVEVNKAYCAMSGYSREELMGMDINDLDAEEKPEETRERIKRIIRNGFEIFETNHRRKDGSVFPIEMSTSYLEERGGQFVCFCRDLTQRKRAEEALKREHMMLARTEALAHVGSWEWEIEGDKVTWSEELFRIYGLEPAEEAPPFAEHQAFYVPEDRPRLLQAVEECVKNGVPYRLEVGITRADGEARHCVVRGIPGRGADGTVRRLYGSLHDITRLKRAEGRLLESEQKWKGILFNTPQVGIALDTQASIVFANKRFLELTGWREDEVIGRNWFDMFIPEDVRDAVQNIFHATMISKTEIGPLSYENEIVLKSGERRTMAWSNVISKDANGDIVDVTCLGIDLTERKQAEKAMQESESRVQAKLNALLEPEGDLETLNLADVVDCDQIQSLMSDFHALTGIGVGILDLEGNVLVGTGWQDICTEFHRVHPETARNCRESDTLLSSGVEPGSFKAYKCKNNMWDMVTPILVGERHVGNLFLGQFFFDDEEPDLDVFREQARRYGFDEDAYLKVCRTIPRWSRQTVHQAMTFYCNLMGFISRLSYTHIKLARATEALRESEQRLSLAARSAALGIWDWDIVNNKMTWDDQMFRLYGITEQPGSQGVELWEKGLHPDDRDFAWEACQAALRGEKAYDVEFRAQWPDGSVRYIKGYGIVLRDSEENPVRMLGGNFDITERRQAEERTAASEEKFRRAFITSPDSININRMSDGKYIEFNEGFLRIMGYKREEVTDRTSEELNIWNNPEDRKRLLESLQSDGYVENLPAQFRRADGTIREGLMSASVIELNGEKHILSITRDVTESKQIEAEREELQIQLSHAQKMESVGRLAGGVAHDFNNMLNVILGYTQLAFDGLPADSPLRNDLREVRKAAERSANLTRQLLAFARKQTVAPKVVDINGIISSMLQMLKRLIGEDIDLLWKPRAQVTPVRIDPGQVDQLLVNLVVNARDAIGHRNGKITIETSNTQFDEDYCADHAGFVPGDYVMLAVSDDGCGMDAETSAQVFEPFFTTKGKGLGTGLGLATSYGIVKQNNGFVNLYSEPDKGTTFRIYLPATEEESHERADSRTAATAPVGGDETTLVVEDEAAILDMTRIMLERLGYTVLTAGTPSEAMRLAQEQSDKIDLIITDVVMPEMNGRDLIESLQEYCPDAGCLFMSGYTANVIAHRGVLDDGVNFIQKPFSPDDLARKVREALES